MLKMSRRVRHPKMSGFGRALEGSGILRLSPQRMTGRATEEPPWRRPKRVWHAFDREVVRLTLHVGFHLVDKPSPWSSCLQYSYEHEDDGKGVTRVESRHH